MIKKRSCQSHPKFVRIFSIFRRLKDLICRGELFPKKIRKLVTTPLGASMILIIFFIPLIMYGVNYLVEYSKKSDVETSNFEVYSVIGKNLAKFFNPGKTWSEQEEYLYSKAAQIYNDGVFYSTKKMSLEYDKTIKVGTKSESISITNLHSFYPRYSTNGRPDNLSFSSDKAMLINCQPFADFVYNESTRKVSYLRSDAGIPDDIVYIENKYKQDTSKLELSLNSDGNILVKCKELKKQSKVTLPRNDVDIIIAIPTNRASNTTTNDKDAVFGDYSNASTANDTPIRQIAKACQLFLQPFLHTAGVAVGIIPYSGKVSISPYRDDSIVTETLMSSNPSGGLAYAVQAMFYGSDGKLGGDVILHRNADASLVYGSYLNWGSDSYGRPIMARRGQLSQYRGMYLNSGAITNLTGLNSLLLDMTTSPTGDNLDYKFMTMNTNPCYLGFCNTLAMTCEKDCPTYKANPYFMTELTSDIQELVFDLELFVPFKDERNKSNFLFLPIVMAGNLFSWGEHPSELSSTGRVPEESRANKKRVVVVIANAPDNFEPQEMTYLGFNNDYSEIPMIESDTILFNKDRGYVYEDGKYKGVKGAVSFESSFGDIDEENGGYLFPENWSEDVTARISFPNKAMLRIVTERVIPATITVYDDNGVEDNVGTQTFWKGTKILNFQGPQQVSNYSDLGTKFQAGYYTTKGPNFGHNLSTKKVKIKFFKCKLNKSTLWNQILRFYGAYSPENGHSLIENTSGSVWSGAPNAMKKRLDPCIDCHENYNSSKTELTGWIFGSASDTYTDTCSRSASFSGDCYKEMQWRGRSSIYGTIYASDGTEDVCSTYSRYEDYECQTPCSSISSSNSYYIGSYNFKPRCLGIASLSKFVCALDHFQYMEPGLGTDSAQINDSTVGSIVYDLDRYGTSYRSYQPMTVRKVEQTCKTCEDGQCFVADVNAGQVCGDLDDNGGYDCRSGYWIPCQKNCQEYDCSYTLPVNLVTYGTLVEKTCQRCEDGRCFVADANAGQVCGDLDDNGGYDCRSGYWIPCQKNCQDYDCSYMVPSDSASIGVFLGKFTIDSFYYYNVFANKKRRERTIKETLYTYRTFPQVSSGDQGSDPPNSPCCSEIWKEQCVQRQERVHYTHHLTRSPKNYDSCDEKTCEWDKWWKEDGNPVTRNLDCGDCAKTGCAICATDNSYSSPNYNDLTDYTFYFCTETKRCWGSSCDYYYPEPRYDADPYAYLYTTYDTSYNTSTSCSGVCWQGYVSTLPSGWSTANVNKTVDCSTIRTPYTTDKRDYTYQQYQYSSSCLYSEKENNNSKCQYPSIEEPHIEDVEVEYAKYRCSGSSCSSCSLQEVGGMPNRTGEKWTEEYVTRKRLGALYKRNPDGSTVFPTYEVCDTSGNNCYEATSSELDYNPGLRRTGSIDNSRTTTGIYRYNLYNFFFVSGDGPKSTEYSYDNDGKLTSTISSESSSDLLNNKGIYLLPVDGEEDTYWVCFCGDADLQLEFEDATDSSVTFTNITPVGYQVNLDSNGQILETPGVEVNYIDQERIFYIHPNQIVDKGEDDNYYVDLKITGKTRILSIELTNRPFKDVSTTVEGASTVKAYDHPDIISDNLINTRIIDGYDQGKYKQMKLYGNMNYNDRTDLPAVSAMHHLFYNPKDGISEKKIYPNVSAESALSEEEGDFFIQLWDWRGEVPTVVWKIGNAFRQETSDITVSGSGFSPFKSNYAFNGLHRMFFPYNTYNKNYAGYSYAKHSAQVFMGFTLPINYILVNNGYQQTYSLSSGQVSNYTKPNTALSNLAKDACTKLKTDLSNNKGDPMVFLVKYRTDATLSLESCADYKYSVNNEKDLLKIMRQISLDIEESSRTNDLSIDVSDI